MLDVGRDAPLELVVRAGLHALPPLRQFDALLRASGGGSFAAIAGGAVTVAAAMTGVVTGGGRAATGGAAASSAAAMAGGAAAELPLEITLPPALHFHSIFACPVSRQQCYPESDPPMLLACGHVIGRDSLAHITVSARMPGRFKCPTCPLQQTANQAMELVME